jgi:hypothetical protein
MLPSVLVMVIYITEIFEKAETVAVGPFDIR